jgi:hypothetical protein
MRRLATAAVIALGALQAWASRFVIEPDGVNYLDVARAYLHHDWHDAVNSYWSPLYSWLLAAAMRFGPSSPYWESTVLHAVNLAIYASAVVCFLFFIRVLSRKPLSRAWILWLFVLFYYATAFMIGVGLDTPDMMVAAVLFAATGLLTQIGRGATWSSCAALGAVLGVGYLAKAVLFPVAFVFLICAFVAGNRRHALAALAAFVFVSAPFLITISLARNRLTFGETGSLNYAWYVAGTGTLLHPVHTLSRDPAVRKFAAPIGGTYPPWYNAPFWFDGLRPRIQMTAQMRAIGRDAAELFRIFSMQRALAVALLIVILTQSSFLNYAGRFAELWTIWLPHVFLIAFYLLVHVESRFLGASFVVLWVSMFWAGEMAGTQPRVLRAALLASALALAVPVAKNAAGDMRTATRPPIHKQWDVAEALQKAGMRRGDFVAVLGHTNIADYWAHLACVRIVADMPEEDVDKFWKAPAPLRAHLVKLFAQSGAKFLVSRSALADDGWIFLGNTGYSAMDLRGISRSEGESQPAGTRPVLCQ